MPFWLFLKIVHFIELWQNFSILKFATKSVAKYFFQKKLPQKFERNFSFLCAAVNNFSMKLSQFCWPLYFCSVTAKISSRGLCLIENVVGFQ